MLTVEDLEELIASSGFTPLTLAELQNMIEIMTGIIRNMPLRQDQKSALILQVNLAELALLNGLYIQSMLALIVLQNMLNSLSASGSAAAVASADNLASLALEGLSYRMYQAIVVS